MSHRKARLLRLLVVVAVVAAAAVTALVGGAGSQPRAGAVARPLLTQPRSARAATQPRPTSQCLTVYGIHCYSPAQFEKAYDLGPLHALGVAGAGQTIAIVDSFGSPTIVQDLHQFDQTFGVSNPWGIPVDPAIAKDPNLTVIHARRRRAAVRPHERRHGRLGRGDDARCRVGARVRPEGEHPAGRDAGQRDRGRNGLPRDRPGRELRDQPPPGRALSRRASVRPRTRSRACSRCSSSGTRSRTPRRTTSRCSAPPVTRDRRTSSSNLEDLFPYPGQQLAVERPARDERRRHAADPRQCRATGSSPDVVWNDWRRSGAGGGGPSHVFAGRATRTPSSRSSAPRAARPTSA